MSDIKTPQAGASSSAPVGSAGLVDGTAERFVGDLHKLSRQQLAEVAAYCIQLMAKPRHTVIPDDHWMLKHQSPTITATSTKIVNDHQTNSKSAN